MWDKEEGNGFTFENHTQSDFIYACERAMGTFRNKPKYLKLRQNAFTSTMDGERVSKAWLSEFFRLRRKVFSDERVVQETLLKIKVWSPQSYQPIHTFEELFGLDKKLQKPMVDIDEGAEEEKEIDHDANTNSRAVLKEVEEEEERYHHIFLMPNKGPRYQQVQLCGSFDNWQIRHAMTYDQQNNQWFIILHLKKGKYSYKYIINGNQWVINDKENKEKDAAGNVNNVVEL